MKISQMILEMLKIQNLSLQEKEMLEGFKKKLFQMQMLSPNQIKWVKEKYDSLKRQRKVGQSRPYYSKPPEDETHWDAIGGIGLNKQKELLDADTFWECVVKVRKMSSEERKEWFRMATEVAELKV